MRYGSGNPAELMNAPPATFCDLTGGAHITGWLMLGRSLISKQFSRDPEYRETTASPPSNDLGVALSHFYKSRPLADDRKLLRPEGSARVESQLRMAARAGRHSFWSARDFGASVGRWGLTGIPGSNAATGLPFRWLWRRHTVPETAVQAVRQLCFWADNTKAGRSFWRKCDAGCGSLRLHVFCRPHTTRDRQPDPPCGVANDQEHHRSLSFCCDFSPISKVYS